MARHRKGTSKRNRGCGLCKPHRRQGNGGKKRDRALGCRHPAKHNYHWTELV